MVNNFIEKSSFKIYLINKSLDLITKCDIIMSYLLILREVNMKVINNVYDIAMKVAIYFFQTKKLVNLKQKLSDVIQ